MLLHDVGKPEVREIDEEGRVMFWRHDRVGRRMVAEIGERLRLSRRFVDYLGILIRQHLRLGFLVREQPLTRRALARYRRDVTPFVFESVAVSLCDRLATRGEKTSRASIARHYRLARSVWSQVTKAPLPHLLSGDDVMQHPRHRRRGRPSARRSRRWTRRSRPGRCRTWTRRRAFLLDWWARGGGEGPASDVTARRRPDA